MTNDDGFVPLSAKQSAVEEPEEKPDPMMGLEVHELWASFGGDAVIRSVSLRLDRGRTLSLLGPSGCGKTTLLRSIAGLHPLDAGTVAFGDRIVAGRTTFVPPERRRVGMVFQDGALFPHLSVLDNVTFGLRDHRNPAGRAREVLRVVGMDTFRSRSPGTLSGGQKQRVALARALAPEPEILLLDEPFSALDAGLRVGLRREVKSILADLGVTVVVVTHDQEEAFILGDQVAVMNEGKIEQVGSPASLYRQPNSAWVAGFVGEANLLDGHRSGDVVSTEIGPVPVQEGVHERADQMQLLVRPEQLVLSECGSSVVTSAEYFGHDVRYEVALQSGIRLGVRSMTEDFTVGDSVAVEFRGEPVAAWPTRKAMQSGS